MNKIIILIIFLLSLNSSAMAVIVPHYRISRTNFYDYNYRDYNYGIEVTCFDYSDIKKRQWATADAFISNREEVCAEYLEKICNSGTQRVNVFYLSKFFQDDKYKRSDVVKLCKENFK